MKDMVGTAKITDPRDAMLHLILKYADRNGEMTKLFVETRKLCREKGGGNF
jgi:hypothetical protein